jgi:hypothetical protein
MAIVAVAAGIVAVVISLFVSVIIGAILGFVAIGLGGVARGQASTKGGMPIAIAGMVLGWIAVGLNIYVAIAD